MTYDHRITGHIIHDLREKRGITQEALSGLAAISRSHLAEIETGRVKANVETLWRISEALGLKLSFLIRLAEDAIEENASR